MRDYVLKPIRPATLAKIERALAGHESHCLTTVERVPVCLSINAGDFENTDKGWMRRVNVPEVKPEFIYQFIYGEGFPYKGGILGVFRIPGKGNWHKTYAPALKRVVRRAGYAANHRWYLEWADPCLWKNRNYPNYEWDGKEFIPEKI